MKDENSNSPSGEPTPGSHPAATSAQGLRLTVIGATRGIGLKLAKAALEDGHFVTALVRDSSRMPLKNDRLRTVEGNALDRKAIEIAVDGQDVVCNCLGTTNVLKSITLFSRCAENLSEIIQPNQLLIAVTGIGAGDSRGHGGFLYDKLFLPFVLRRIYADKDVEEAIIRRKIARWVIVRPGFLNNGPRTGKYRALTDLTGVRGGSISRADVADFILSQAKSPQFIGQTPMIIY